MNFYYLHIFFIGFMVSDIPRVTRIRALFIFGYFTLHIHIILFMNNVFDKVTYSVNYIIFSKDKTFLT